jgi:hypothetical protein
MGRDDLSRICVWLRDDNEFIGRHLKDKFCCLKMRNLRNYELDFCGGGFCFGQKALSNKPFRLKYLGIEGPKLSCNWERRRLLEPELEQRFGRNGELLAFLGCGNCCSTSCSREHTNCRAGSTTSDSTDQGAESCAA